MEARDFLRATRIHAVSAWCVLNRSIRDPHGSWVCAVCLSLRIWNNYYLVDHIISSHWNVLRLMTPLS